MNRRVVVYMYMYLDNIFCRFFQGTPTFRFGVQPKTLSSSPQIVSTKSKRLHQNKDLWSNPSTCRQQQPAAAPPPQDEAKTKVGARLQLIIAKTNFSNTSFCIWNLQFHRRIPIVPNEACDTSSLWGSITLR